ncbi:hypothetical protein ACH4LZ_30255 [Streptomyces halstedii]|uniref:hypothetical protein n=1 Tax=Streptomyces halstedii TaxID=1944 RepID=UPI00378D77D9
MEAGDDHGYVVVQAAEAEVRESAEAGGAQVGQDVILAGGGVIVSAAGPGGGYPDQSALLVDQDHLTALPGDLLQGAVQARRLRGEEGDQLVPTAADGGPGHVVPVGQALIVAQHGQDDHGDPSGRQDPPPDRITFR